MKDADEYETFFTEWGIDPEVGIAGGLAEERIMPVDSGRVVYLLQRKPDKFGLTLGKTTGWIHRLTLKKRNVIMINNVTYNRIDNEGLYITIKGNDEVLNVDNVIICAGQESNRELFAKLEKENLTVHLIGGAERALELDAKRAIEQGARLAASI